MEKQIDDIIDMEDVIKKVGGRFKLAVLLQKRFQSIDCLPYDWETNANKSLQPFLKEIMEDKVKLISQEEVEATAHQEDSVEEKKEQTEQLDDIDDIYIY